MFERTKAPTIGRVTIRATRRSRYSKVHSLARKKARSPRNVGYLVPKYSKGRYNRNQLINALE